MVLKNKINKEQGFTIVELLIVIVVIGILAAITIVAYNGVQTRAKTTAAASTAETVQKKAEVANSIVSAYPAAATDFAAQTDSTLAGSGITLLAAAPTSAASTSSASYRKCTTPAATKPAQQAEVGVWNYTTAAAVYTYLGGAVSADCTTWGAYLSGGPY
jgi:prepilin-type N-terminal cleavage/methylation domain-containing protein